MMCDDEEIDHTNASMQSGIQMKENLDCGTPHFPDDHVNEGVSTVPPEKNQQISSAKVLFNCLNYDVDAYISFDGSLI